MMTHKKKLGDRRAAVRFEIGGQFWGTLEVMEPLPIRNISRGGVLVDAGFALQKDSMHSVHLMFPDYESVVEGRVRHLTAVRTAVEGDRYLIGFEFVDPDLSTLEHIDRLVSANGTPS